MTPPKRRLGLTVTAAIVVANMIGVGVFTSTGFQAASLHDPGTMLVCWVVGGILALCGAATYAELGSMMPRAGGEYVYLREAYHPVVGFMSGWVSLTAGFSASIATSALAFATYLVKLAGPLAGHEKIVAVLLIVAVTALHSFDSKVGGWVQAVFTIIKVLLIAVFVIAGVFFGHGNWSNLGAQNGGLSNVATPAFATSLMYVSFAYLGWNAAAYIANEVERPEKTLPRALLLGTGIVMALYVAVNIVFLYAVSPAELATGAGGGPVLEVGDLAARKMFGASAGSLVSTVIALALISSVSAMIMAGPRVYAAMAHDRALPTQLAKHNKRGVPMYAVLTQGVVAILFVAVGDLGELMRFVAFTLAIFSALTVGAVFVLRRRGMRGAYRTWGYPVTPLLFIVMSIWVAYAQMRAAPKESLVVGALLAVGFAIYFMLPRDKPELPDESLPEMAAAARPDLPEARVITDDRG